MEFWIVYDLDTGEDLWVGQGPTGTAAVQQPPAGAGLIVVPEAVVAQRPIDLGALKVALAIGVDRQAEAVRQRFLTPGAGQAMTYQRKEAEARAWMVDNTAPTPFLSAEAVARGMTVAQLAAEVIALADAWTQIGSAIEGTRMGAKTAVQAAGTLGTIVAAAQIDWSAFDAFAAG